MTSTLKVACGCIISNERVLLAQRRENRLWELPGGKQEPGESLRGCLARELWEELAIRVEVGPALGRVTHQSGSMQIELHCFFCRILAGEPVAQEHAAVTWAASHELPGFRLCPADRKLLKKMDLCPMGLDAVRLEAMP